MATSKSLLLWLLKAPWSMMILFQERPVRSELSLPCCVALSYQLWHWPYLQHICAGAPADCPLTFHSVPVGSDGRPCCGRGAAIYAQGTCQCYTGAQLCTPSMTSAVAI